MLRCVVLVLLVLLATIGTACRAQEPSSTQLARVAFTSDRDGNSEIYVMDADGSNPTRLTNNFMVGIDRAVNYPSWSPDGGKIVFCSLTGDIYGELEASINVMDADGSNLIRATDRAATFVCTPAWSPDSAKMAFTSDRDGNDEIYVMDADSANETRLTDNPAADVDPQWSPDGSKIVFSSGSNIPGTDLLATLFADEIYVMDADGSNLTQLTRNTLDDDDVRPAWSPDGSKIAFLSTRDQKFVYQIYTMDADGSNQAPLTDNPEGIECFEWSPDGSKIAFSSEEGTHLMDANGSGETLLNTHNSCFGDLAWSLDGRNIAKIVLSEGNEIYVMDADGSNLTRLTNNSNLGNVSPAWGPR